MGSFEGGSDSEDQLKVFFSQQIISDIISKQQKDVFSELKALKSDAHNNSGDQNFTRVQIMDYAPRPKTTFEGRKGRKQRRQAKKRLKMDEDWKEGESAYDENKSFASGYELDFDNQHAEIDLALINSQFNAEMLQDILPKEQAQDATTTTQQQKQSSNKLVSGYQKIGEEQGEDESIRTS